MRKSPSVTAVSPAAKRKPISSGPRVDKERQAIEQEYQKMMDQVTQQNMELKMSMEQVEREREFYFTKLREIEVFVQSMLENPGDMANEMVLKEIQSIMYKTEEGFEIPDQAAIEEDIF